MSLSAEGKLDEIYRKMLTKIIDTFIPSLRRGLFSPYSVNKDLDTQGAEGM